VERIAAAQRWPSRDATQQTVAEATITAVMLQCILCSDLWIILWIILLTTDIDDSANQLIDMV
jgi:hypothetical protein